jgi:hypothetical protein
MTARFTWLIAAVAFATTAHATNTSGSVRICLAPATAEASVGSNADLVGAVRESFTTFLTGPGIAITPLEARLSGQIRAEAQQSQCSYVLFPTVRHERKETGLLGRIAAGAVQSGAWEAAGAAHSSTTRVLAGAASAGAASYSAFSWIRSRDVLNLDYRLEAGDGHVLIEKKSQNKASSDGQDLLTPLVQSASETIVSTLSASAR